MRSPIPGRAFGSCRVKLKSLDADRARYDRLLEVLRAHDVRWFLYNGGNDSADTALKVSQLAKASGYDLTCIGVPKTIDNDLAVTDTSPWLRLRRQVHRGVGARSGAGRRGDGRNVDPSFIYEAMGRHAGWLAAAAGLAGNGDDEAPHIILLPERAYDEAAFPPGSRRWSSASAIAWWWPRGHCHRRWPLRCRCRRWQGLVWACAAGRRGRAPGWPGQGSAGPEGALGTARLHCKRSARHLASRTDWEQAQAVGKAAVQLALKGQNGVMPVIVRSSDAPYRWKIEAAPLSKIANHEKKMPAGFIRRDGFGITAKARAYLSPLIKGEAPLPYGTDGLAQVRHPEECGGEAEAAGLRGLT